MADGRGDQVVGVGIVRERPLRQGVGGEHDDGRRRGQRLEVALGRPRPDGRRTTSGRTSCRCRCSRSRPRRAARSWYWPTLDAEKCGASTSPTISVTPDAGELGHAVLDEGGGVLGAAGHDEPTGRRGIQRRRDRVPLGPGPFGQRRDPTDRVVAAGQVGELFGGSADGHGGCGCSTPRRRRDRWASRTPSPRRRPSSASPGRPTRLRRPRPFGPIGSTCGSPVVDQLDEPLQRARDRSRAARRDRG